VERRADSGPTKGETVKPATISLEDAVSVDQPDVLIVGGGINGAGVFRELALQGVSVMLVEKGDFCSGSSAAPSRMIHGGLRYLEYGETKLVRESLHERDALLRNAPHYVRPIETVMPLYSWFKGLFSAIPKFIRGKGKPSQRGAVTVMIGLTFYDIFTRASRMVPKRSFSTRAKTRKSLPGLGPGVVGSATYWDAQISYPERLALELILDGERASASATALNYVSFVELTDDDAVVIRDEIDGSQATVRPRIVVNASGGWIDLTNAAMGADTRSIDGVKGSHLVIDDPELLDVLDGRMVYFENSDQRICIVFPWQGKVLAGSTEVPLADPDTAVCTPEETQYILDSLGELFPGRTVDPATIVSTFSGVRPLVAGNGEVKNAVSRDHSGAEVSVPGSSLPIYSMAGGKWTTFRSFSEQMADVALDILSLERKVSTDDLAIGGGRDFPQGASERDDWLRTLSHTTGLSRERAQEMLDRYGTTAIPIAEDSSGAADRRLTNCEGYSEREISWIVEHEKVRRLDDLVLRRTDMALLGKVTMPLLEELSQLCVTPLSLSEPDREQAVAATAELLTQRFGINIKEGQPT
jgi:glycerol-3-phosphate dehydrogenase